MAWYKDGTVSIVNGQTSAAGVGTKWASNARVGDAFRGPDGEWYEVVNIASETTLGIFPAYQGATVSASASYVIAPMQGYVKDSADRLRAATVAIEASVSTGAEAAAQAQASALAAKTSETNAQASANASEQSRVAAGVSETNAGNSANAADQSKTAAGISETNAGNSATAANNSKVAAGISETNAANSATQAAASVSASYKDAGAVDLSSGSYPAVPTVSSIWNVSVAGTVSGTRYNVGDNLIYSVPSSAWRRVAQGDVIDVLTSTDASKALSANQGRALKVAVDALVSNAQNTLIVYEYIATAGQSVFSGADRNGLTLNVTPLGCIPFVNGVTQLKTTEYTLTSSTLTLLTGNPLLAGDIVQVMAFGSFNVANVYTQAQIDAMKTQSTTDPTVGKLIKVGDFGLGADAVVLAATTNWDTITGVGDYAITAATGGNAPVSGSDWFITVKKVGSSIKQWAMGRGPSPSAYARSFNGTVWTAWDFSFSKSNILGTVSQVSGVPTGAIIETGSNANGTYIKYADGTLICRFGIALPSMPPSAAVAVAWSYPAGFTLQPTVTGMAGSQAGNSGFLNVGIDGAPSTTGVTFAAGNGSGATLSSAYIHVEAIGRWF